MKNKNFVIKEIKQIKKHQNVAIKNFITVDNKINKLDSFINEYLNNYKIPLSKKFNITFNWIICLFGGSHTNKWEPSVSLYSITHNQDIEHNELHYIYEFGWCYRDYDNDIKDEDGELIEKKRITCPYLLPIIEDLDKLCIDISNDLGIDVVVHKCYAKDLIG